MRIRVKILDTIVSPFGTYYTDKNGKFLYWKHCRNIDGRWYFVTEQNFKANNSKHNKRLNTSIIGGKYE